MSEHAARRIPALIVSDGALLDRFVDLVERGADSSQSTTFLVVDDLYAALAAVGQSNEPPPAGHARDETNGFSQLARPRCVAYSLVCEDDPEIIREAFRRLDPDLRVVLIAQSDREASWVIGPAGPDLLLPEPENETEGGSAEASFLRLANALQIACPIAEGTQPAPATPDARPEARHVPGATSMPPTRTLRRPPTRSSAGTRAESDRDVVDLVIGDALEAFAARTRKPAEADAPMPDRSPHRALSIGESASAGEPLGDTDLVDAVRAGSAALRARALELIRAQSGAADVELLPIDECPEVDGAPVIVEGTTAGLLVSSSVERAKLAQWADWLAHWLALDRDLRELERLAWTDELTDAGNRRAFERALEDAITAARRERRIVTLMCFDIDDFKSYNDRFGHEAGDAVLRETVALLRAVIRKGDLVFRVGGDEFVVLFADGRDGNAGAPGPAGIESVETITQRFRERICELRLTQLGLDAPGTISVSAGVATFPWDGYDARSLLRHADQLALQSKRCGKNTITFGPGARDHCRDA